MPIHFEVRYDKKQPEEGEPFDTSKHDTREEAEQAARELSRRGFFSQVWQVRECTPEKKGERGYLVNDYLCEYAAAEVSHA